MTRTRGPDKKKRTRNDMVGRYPIKTVVAVGGWYTATAWCYVCDSAHGRGEAHANGRQAPSKYAVTKR